MDRLAEIVEKDGAMGLVRVAMNARDAYEDGRVCECAEPVLSGDGLMCRGCLLENMGQREVKEARIRGPHAYEVGPVGLCDVCMHDEDDPRHTPASSTEDRRA